MINYESHNWSSIILTFNKQMTLIPIKRHICNILRDSDLILLHITSLLIDLLVIVENY